MYPILITGENGYLGSRVAQKLKLLGCKFRTLDKRLENIKGNSLSEYRAVIHCAGSLRNNSSMLELNNVRATLKLLNGLKSKTKVIFISSRSVYQLYEENIKDFKLIDEVENVSPFDEYGYTKFLAEEIIKSSGHDYIIFRSSALFGHPIKQSTFPDFSLDNALIKGSISLAQIDRDVDYLDVESFASLLISATESKALFNKIYNVAGPIRSLHEMIQSLIKVVQSNTNKKVVLDYIDLPNPRFPLLNANKVHLDFKNFHQESDECIFQRMVESRLNLVNT